MNGKKPGKKSSAELSTKISAVRVKRPDPPESDSLTDEGKAVWRAVTATRPPDWWRPDTFPLLAQYCRHVVTARRIAVMIEDLMQGASDSWLDDFEKLTRMQEREGRAANALARSMRLTQQAQMHPRSAARRTANVPPPDEGKPWEGPQDEK